MTGARLLDIINAQRSLKVLLTRVSGEDGLVETRRLNWSDAPPGLGWPHDGERVLGLFIESVGGRPGQSVAAKAVSKLLDSTLDAIVQANRSLLYDELIDVVELEVADLEAPAPLAHAIASMVPVVVADGQPRQLPTSLPTVAQVRCAEDWLIAVLERVAVLAGPLTFRTLVLTARDAGLEPLGLSGWGRTLLAVAALKSHDAPDAAHHLVRRAAQWWAGQNTFDPFPDSNGNGVADEVGPLQHVFDTFADLARSFEAEVARRARP